jgi:hypothetical protein
LSSQKLKFWESLACRLFCLCAYALPHNNGLPARGPQFPEFCEAKLRKTKPQNGRIPGVFAERKLRKVKLRLAVYVWSFTK